MSLSTVGGGVLTGVGAGVGTGVASGSYVGSGVCVGNGVAVPTGVTRMMRGVGSGVGDAPGVCGRGVATGVGGGVDTTGVSRGVGVYSARGVAVMVGAGSVADGSAVPTGSVAVGAAVLADVIPVARAVAVGAGEVASSGSPLSPTIVTAMNTSAATTTRATAPNTTRSINVRLRLAPSCACPGRPRHDGRACHPAVSASGLCRRSRL